jgi:hypothetical protein
VWKKPRVNMSALPTVLHREGIDKAFVPAEEIEHLTRRREMQSDQSSNRSYSA